jgi:hypothetical protein
MTQKENEGWPTSSVEMIDRKISDALQRVVAGDATSREISEVTGLIRERAESMMPGVFRNSVHARAAKKAS